MEKVKRGHDRETDFVLSFCVALFASPRGDDHGGRVRKRVPSLRLCVSSLHRDHANLLCIFKRLFNVVAQWLGSDCVKNRL